MKVSACRIILDFHNNDSMKEKSKNVQELCDMLRKKFNCSAVEIASFDDPQSCVLGIAVVIPENWAPEGAQHFIQKICSYIDEHSAMRLISEDIKIHYHD